MLKPTSDHVVCKQKRRYAGLFVLAATLLGSPAPAQTTSATPVFTDDSPEASQWYDRAADQFRTGNVAESLRLYQRLLDQYPNRLLKTPETGESFTSVRTAVQNTLLGRPDLLKAYIETNEPDARRLLDEGEAERVFITRFLTPSGLVASLDLAEAMLVRARFDFAADVLAHCEGHPALAGEREARWGTLCALTGVYGERPTLVAHAIGALGDSAEAAQLRRLVERLQSTFTPPERWRSVSAADPLRAATLGQMGKSPTWRYDMDSPRAAATTRNRQWDDESNPLIDREMARQLAVLPVVTSDFVYVHNGMTLTALDRFDGRERWTADYEIASASPDSGRFGGMFDTVSVQNDPTTVALDQDRVVAIVSRPVSDPDLKTMLVCHDAGSGRRLWVVTPGGIHPDLSGASFIGVPVVYDGLVIVPVRKQTLRLASDYLVAIELTTGEQAWHQHLASSAIYGYYAVLPASAPSVADGTVYLSTPLGAITAIDARTGLVRWLQVLEPFGARMRGELTPPCAYDTMQLTPIGLVGFTPSRRGIVVLDPATGEQRSFFAASTWGEPLYLAQTDDALLAVGPPIPGASIARIPFDDLDNPQRDWITLRSDEFLNGRVTSGPGQVFVATNQRLRLLDPSGTEIESAEISQLAVPVVVAGEVLLASIDRLESYIPYAVGEPHLRARLDANPHDPNPAISLARLAFQHRRLDALMSSIDSAIDIINANPLSEINSTAQQRLFAGLLDMAPHSVLPDDLSDAIYYRLELLAATPQQRLAYLLSHASSLSAAGQPAAAIDAYQSILTTPALTGEPWSEAGSTRPAGDVARFKLTELVAAGHTALYAPYETTAEREFESARQQGQAEQLLSVARRYPLARVAASACIAAAERLQLQSESDAAAAALRFALHLKPREPELGRVRSSLLQLYQANRQWFEALQLLRSIERTDPAASITMASGQVVSIAQSRADLVARHDRGGPMAEIGSVRTLADIKEGQVLLTPVFGRPSSQFALVRDNRNLIGYDAQNAARFIEILDSATKELLSVESDIALLAVLSSRGQRTVEAYDMNEQRTLWRTSSFDDWFVGPVARTPNGQLLPAVTQERIILAEETGRIGCLDRTTGEVLWAVNSAIDAVKYVSATESLILIAGEEQSGGGRRGRREVEGNHVVLLRPETGAKVLDLQTDRFAPLDFAALSPRGELVYASLGRLYCYDTLRRQQRWSIDSEALIDPLWATLVGSSLLVFRDNGQPVSIDLATARQIPQSRIRPIERNEAAPVLLTHRDRFVLKTHNGVYVLEEDGSVTGMMAGSGGLSASVQSVALAADRIIALLTVDNAARGLPRSVEIHAMDLSGRRIDQAYELDDRTELPRPNGLQVLDGGIVIDAGRDIVYMEAPVEDGP